MQRADLPAILAIQDECYPEEMCEDAAVVQQRLAVAGEHAWVAKDDAGACAYLFGYLSQVGKVTRLGAGFEQSAQPDCLYLHDLAVSPRAKGLGLGPWLVVHALESARARKLGSSALVSVQQSRVFWERLGYRVHDDLGEAELRDLATYASPAWYMVKPLAE